MTHFLDKVRGLPDRLRSRSRGRSPSTSTENAGKTWQTGQIEPDVRPSSPLANEHATATKRQPSQDGMVISESRSFKTEAAAPQSSALHDPSESNSRNELSASSIGRAHSPSDYSERAVAEPSQSNTNNNLEALNDGENPLQGSLEGTPPTEPSISDVGENTLWTQAYFKLKEKDSELVEKFNECLGLTLSGIKSSSDKMKVREIQQEALQALEEVNSSKNTGLGSKLRNYFEQGIRFINASKDFISAAVSANPYAALAWTGISLLLPVLLNPTQENEAAIKGLDCIANLMIVYHWREKSYLHVPSFAGPAVRLYATILEYEATLLVHIRQNPPKRWIKNVFKANDWADRTASIQKLDADCKVVVDAIAAARVDEWREQEQKWQHELLSQLSNREEKEWKNIRKLYSNYEAGKNVNPIRTPGTCEWFLNHNTFLTWREKQQSSLIWVSADPGCGKSVLAKCLVDGKGDLLTVNSNIPIICYFFFKDGDLERKDAVKALSAFLHQLILQQPDLYKHAKQDFLHKSDRFLNDFDALWNVFLRITRDPSLQEIICVLDALDECQEASRNGLIQSLVDMYSSREATKPRQPIVKFLVTSRPGIGIVRGFKRLTDNTSEVRLRGEEESEQISNEIDLVIDYRVKTIGSSMVLNEGDQSHLRKNLKERRHRTYLWLYLTLDDIEKRLELSRNDIANIATNIPEDVEQAYTNILNKSPDRKRARKLLHITLAATRPMTLKEVNVAMVVEEGQRLQDLDIWPSNIIEDRIKNICGLFISVVDSKVYLIHQTAREFLISNEHMESLPSIPKSLDGWKWSFDLNESNLILAKICILYLQLQNFEILLGLKDAVPEDSDDENSSNFESALEVEEEGYGFLDYAAQSWPTHFTLAKTLPDSTLIATIANSICSPSCSCFRLWFRIYWQTQTEHWYKPWQSTTGLIVASILGHEAVFKLQIDYKDTDPNQGDNDDRTPLIWASRGGHEEIVRLLLARKVVETGIRDSNHRTALHEAAAAGSERIVEMLLARSMNEVDEKDEFGFTPLMMAVDAHHTNSAVVQVLLATGKVNVNATDEDGDTALSLAVADGKENMVRILLAEVKIRADLRNDKHETPLILATKNSSAHILQALLQHESIDINAQDESGRSSLSWAAGTGDSGSFEIMVTRKDIDVDLPDSNGHSPFWWAALNGHEAIMQLLLEQRGLDVNRKDKQARTVISSAAEGGWATLPYLLGIKGIQAGLKDDRGRTPLSFAAGGGHRKAMRCLLQREDVRLDSRDKDGRTALSWAAGEGFPKAVKLMLKCDNVDADNRDNNGRTLLSWAVVGGPKAVKTLLECDDVDINSRDNDGRTALSWAIVSGGINVITLLLERDDVHADNRDNNGETPLSRAAKFGDEKAVKVLLERNDVDANSRDKNERTPLSWAAGGGYTKIVKNLLEQDNVDINSRDDNGQMPLSWAAKGGCTKAVKILLERGGAHIDSRDDDGRTPLSWAAGEGHRKTVKVLLGYDGVDVNSRDNDGLTPLSWAAEGGHRKTVKVLLGCDRVDVDSRDEDGQTPLSTAAEMGHFMTMRILIERDDVRLDSEDNSGRTPLWYAKTRRHRKATKLLKDSYERRGIVATDDIYASQDKDTSEHTDEDEWTTDEGECTDGGEDTIND